MKCTRCRAQAVVALPSHNAAFCEDCFRLFFSRQVETAIHRHHMFTPADRILVALSGGKDSLALMLELSLQGYDVTGLHVDLAIPGSSPAARAKVEAFCTRHSLPLVVIDLATEGLSLPEVRRATSRPICSACGKIKRHYFNRVAMEQGFTVLATGHNLDDEAARLMANTLRWDSAYLSDQSPALPAEDGFAAKVKPLCRLTEFETANYAFLQGIDIHAAPCPYSRGATFTGYKQLLDDLEFRSPGSKFNFYDTFLKQGRPAFQTWEHQHGVSLMPCPECGLPTSSDLCGVCRLRHTLAEKRHKTEKNTPERE